MLEITRLKTSLPSYYDGIYDMQLLNDIEQYMLDNLVGVLNRAKNNLYVESADDAGLKVFEEMLGLKASGSLDDRRINVITSLLPHRAVTLGQLNEILALLEINASATIDGFELIISTSTPNLVALKRLAELLPKYVPANLTYKVINQVSEQSSGDQSLVNASTYATIISFTSALPSTMITERAVLNLATASAQTEIIKI